MADQTSRLTPERLASIEWYAREPAGEVTGQAVLDMAREVRRSWAQEEALRAMVKRMGGEPDEAEKQGGEA